MVQNVCKVHKDLNVLIAHNGNNVYNILIFILFIVFVLFMRFIMFLMFKVFMMFILSIIFIIITMFQLFIMFKLSMFQATAMVYIIMLECHLKLAVWCKTWSVPSVSPLLTTGLCWNQDLSSWYHVCVNFCCNSECLCNMFWYLIGL